MLVQSPDEGRAFLAERLGAVAAGDKAALQHLYDRTSAKLFGICLRILGDREEAEDVLQETYLVVWNRADRFDPGRASPITWLATIARNRSIDRLRQIGSRGSTQPVEDAVDLKDDRLDGLASMVASEESRRLQNCLDVLDQRAHDAIVTAFYGGTTYEELAKKAGVPLGTMKSVIRRGLLKLRECLSL